MLTKEEQGGNIMITLPISDLLLLPGVTFFFKKDVFPSGEITAESVGEDILFVMEKEEKEQMTPDDFYPIGVIGAIDSVDDEGNVRVKVGDRIFLRSFRMWTISRRRRRRLCLRK